MYRPASVNWKFITKSKKILISPNVKGWPLKNKTKTRFSVCIIIYVNSIETTLSDQFLIYFSKKVKNWTFCDEKSIKSKSADGEPTAFRRGSGDLSPDNRQRMTSEVTSKRRKIITMVADLRTTRAMFYRKWPKMPKVVQRYCNFLPDNDRINVFV